MKTIFTAKKRIWKILSYCWAVGDKELFVKMYGKELPGIELIFQEYQYQMYSDIGG